MTETNITVTEADTNRGLFDSRGTVLMLPGLAYSCEMPLLARTTRALQSAGWMVLQAEWQLASLPEDPRSFVERAAARLESAPRQPGPVMLVAKSLGTLTAHWSADRGLPAVWLTPVLKAAGLNPMSAESEALAERIRTYPTANLVVGGTADPVWESGFVGTGEVVEVAGADHALEVEDRHASIRHHEDVASAVADFASSVH